jgi:hypothetical protein
MPLVFTSPAGSSPLRNQDAGSPVTVDLGGGLVYGVDVQNAVWELHTPHNSGASLSPGIGDVAQSFTPERPGRYLVRAVMDDLIGPDPTVTFTALFEVEGAWVKGQALPAATETTEANLPSNEGWGAEMSERMDLLGRSALGRTTVHVGVNTSGGVISAGQVIKLEVAPVTDWVGPGGTALTTPGAVIPAILPFDALDNPESSVGIALETIAVGERGYYQNTGALPWDTSLWSLGQTVFVSNAGAVDVIPGDSTVFLGFVARVGPATGAAAGLLWLTGGDPEKRLWDRPQDLRMPSAVAAIWADGTGLGNDITVYAAETLLDSSSRRWNARKYECVTGGHHLLQVWHTFVHHTVFPWGRNSTEPFVTIEYQFDQIDAQITLTVLESSDSGATLVNKTVTVYPTGDRQRLTVTWAEAVAAGLALDGSLGSTGDPQLLEIRADVTLANASDVGYVGGCDVFWAGK